MLSFFRTKQSVNEPPHTDRRFLSTAIILGITSGLIEGVGHLVLQRLNVLDNSWYEIIWIAALFNGLLLLLAGIALTAAFSVLPDRMRSNTAFVFTMALTALMPCLALMLKEWMKSYSILFLALGLATAFTRWFDRNPEGRLRLFQRSLPWTVLVAVLACAGIQVNSWLRERFGTANLPAASASAPDVLVILIDALRADHLSAYGYARGTSPNIDKIAAEGTLFENAYATSSYSLPSHASILTGLSPHEHGVQWRASKELARRNTSTLGSAFQGFGYRTAAFSANTFWFSREHGFGQGFLHFEDYFHSVTDMVLRTAYGRIASLTILAKLGYDDIAARKRASDINPRVLRWLGDSDSNPFFVFINYMDVHDPYLPPQPYRGRYSKDRDPGGLINWQFHTPETLSSEQLQSEIDAYDGAIAYVDDQIDTLVKALKRRQTSRDLLIVITSDHGEEFMDHGNLLHGHSLYRETIQVPLIFWQPGRIPKGVRIAQPVSNADIAATVMSLAGNRGTLPGGSLDQLWSSSAAVDEWASPLSELEHRPWVGDRYPAHHSSIRSVVTPDLHCIEYTGRRFEAFDWKTDAPEKSNLAEASDVATLMRDCRDRLERSTPETANGR